MLYIALGGCLGAISRLAVSRYMARWLSKGFPFATLTVNLLGSFLLGLLAGGRIGGDALHFWGTGFMGAFTTFSTYSQESVQLAQSRRWKSFCAYLFVTLAVGFLFAYTGYRLAQGARAAVH